MRKIKFLGFIIIVMLFSICNLNTVYGISATLSPSPSSVLQGNTFTVRVSFSDDVCAATFNVSYDTSKLTLVSGETSDAWVEGENLPSFTFKANSGAVGNASISLSGKASDTNFVKYDLSRSTSVTITAPVVTTPTTPTTQQSTTTTTKSSNANLKKLLPNYEGLSPNFNPNITKYSLTVPATATNLGLTVAVEATGAKYWISGEDNLKMGDNTVTVTVTATDGTKKVYTIIVTKAADVEKANAYLSSIVVDGKTLSPAFTAENLEYDIGTVASDVEKLTVLAYAQNENSKVEITGNDSLVEGENIIKILVTAADGTTTKEYTLKVNKEIAKVTGVNEGNDGVNIYDETNSLQDNGTSKFQKFIDGITLYIQQFGLVISLFIFCLFEFVQILYLYKKVNEKKNSDSLNVVKNYDNKDDKNFKSRRRNSESGITNSDSSIKTDNENANLIDDTSDELVDNTTVDKGVDDITDNFEDSKNTEDSDK
jgi:hypothetical protein